MSAAQLQGRKGMEYWLVLMAVAAMSIFYYGIRAAAVIGLACITAVLTDFICLFLRGIPYRRENLSDIGTAVILVLMFPATVPYSIVILSTAFAVAVGTNLFGSPQDQLFPPAALGYLFAVISWRNEILSFPKAGQFLPLFGNDAALHDSLSSVFNAQGSYAAGSLDVWLGAVYGPMGTGCLLLLVIGLAVLLIRRNISFWGTLGFCFGAVAMARWVGMNPAKLLATNMLLFAMLFLVGDKSVLLTRSLFSLLCGAFTGFFTVFLISRFHVEYAVITAVILSCPVWRGIAALQGWMEEKSAQKAADRIMAENNKEGGETEA